MAHDDSELEATYRFLKNRRVSSQTILEGHYQATSARAGEAATTLALHDTTELSFAGEAEREGMGTVGNRAQGFFAHVALAVAEDPARTPLGVIGLRTHARPRRPSAAPRDKESKRWLDLVDDVRARLDPATTIHVMDREADWGTLLSRLLSTKSRFVIRLAHDRRVDEEPEAHLREAFAQVQDRGSREVELSRRSDRKRRVNAKHRHPARSARTTTLSIGAKAVTLKNGGDPLALHVVHVVERDPPAGEQPIEWWLATTEAIDTVEELWRIVDIYRARWLIEEFFKALKSGCRVEDRQLESQHGLENALALLLPVAWQLLSLRALSRSDGSRAASTILTRQQLDVLRHCGRQDLPSQPTVADALGAIAALGGHIKNNGIPGWIVLGRGMDDLLLLELGWAAARRSRKM